MLVSPVVKVSPVGGDHHSLAGFKLVTLGYVDVLRLGLGIAYRRIVEVHPAVQLQSAAGEHAILVVVLGGEEGDTQVLPVDQVPADRMAPVHGAPAGGVGKVLVKEVVFPFIVDKTVGVVDPVSRCPQVQNIFGQCGSLHILLVFA